jgi:hypothetical protein
MNPSLYCQPTTAYSTSLASRLGRSDKHSRGIACSLWLLCPSPTRYGRSVRSILSLVLVLLLGAAFAQDALAAPGVLFVGGWTSDETNDTFAVAWGDVDGDGDLDLAVGNGSGLGGQPNQIYRNDGQGDLSLAWQSTGDARISYAVDLGDMDGDGDLDLAVGNSQESNQVYRNDGTGDLSLAWQSTGDASDTRGIAWGDMDDDGDLDLAVANAWEVNQVYRNEGDATFSLFWESTGDASSTQSVAWGDMDGDGRLDLAFGNNNAQANQIYRNDGAGGFVLAWESTGDGKETMSLVPGDMDGDGDLDLAVGNYNMFEAEVNQIYRNEGDWSFSLVWESIGDLKSTLSVAWGDLDSDGDLDLAAGNASEVNQVYRNEGGASFALVWESTADSKFTSSVAWGDMDGDGDLDLAFGNSNSVVNQIYRNESTQSFPVAWESTGDAQWTESIAWGDMDGDGDLDLAFANYGSAANQVYRNDGPGSFSLAWQSLDDLKDTCSVAWGDMDGDGDLDLAFGNSNGVVNQVYRNEGAGGFNVAWESVADAKDTSDVAWGDMDGDGDLDLAFANGGVFAGEVNQVYRNEVAGSFTLAWESTGDAKDTASVAWGDMDGDGDLDLAFGNRYAFEGEVNQVYRNEGGERFTLAWESTGDWKWTESAVWGDMDGDGDLDLAFGNSLQVNQVYRNEGDGTFSLAWQSTGDAKATSSVAWGDWDGDGDFDLAVGNTSGLGGGEVNQIYRNEGAGSFVLGWESTGDTQDTMSVAWGDMEGDGDLDLAVGNSQQVNQVLENPRQRRAGLPSNAPTLGLLRPDTTGDAAFYASAEILDSATITFTYTLFDDESHPAPSIHAFFSPTGGGSWLAATPTADTQIADLAASPWPTGTEHTFTWDVAADLIKNDNIAFRLEVDQGGPGPYQWPPSSAQTFSFRVEAPWFIQVVDDDGDAVAGVPVYADGQPITRTLVGLTVTDSAGLISSGPLELGTVLTVLAQRHEQPTLRAAHDGWAFRTYLTSLALDDEGLPHPFEVTGPGEQRVVISQTDPLILFNILVSVEWDADEGYLNTVASAFDHASDYLYDVTDGQLAFGRVQIYDQARYWSQADFQISTKNTVRPYAFIGGLTSDDTAHSIRVGRFWNGTSGNQGDWNQPDGYRTLIHEFGHYGLYLYDEYFVRLVDAQGHFTGQALAVCTGVEVKTDENDATNASLMYYHYNASELADSDRWTVNCQNTEQARINGQPDWQTVVAHYGGVGWTINTPSSRETVMAGPDVFPGHLLPFPVIEVHSSGPGGPPRRLKVLAPGGSPFPNALVALYTTPASYTVAIDQGLTDQEGVITIYGALEGDTLQAASFDGAYAGAVMVDAYTAYTLTLSPTGPGRLAAQASTSPYLTLIPGSEGDTLLLEVHDAPAGSLPLNAMVIPAQGGGSPQSASLAYSSSEGAYVGNVSLAGVGLGTGRVRVNGVAAGQWVSINSDYNLLRLLDGQANELASEDGNLQWYVDAGSLQHGADAYSVVLPTGYVPGPMPPGMQVVGTAYEVRFSGASTGLTKPGVLRIHYHPEVMGTAEDLAIYWWDGAAGMWLPVGGERLELDNSVSTAVQQTGIYALMTEPERIYLPLILRR